VIRQGEIREVENHVRVVVLSGDSVNAAAFPIVAPIQRNVHDVPPYLIALTEQDPVKGAVNMGLLHAADPVVVDSQPPVGIVCGPTFERVFEAVNDLFTRD
jgi:mRNA interferase MazF